MFFSVFYVSLRIPPICCNMSEKRQLFFFLLKSIGPQWAKLNRCADQVQIDVQIDGEIKPNRRKSSSSVIYPHISACIGGQQNTPTAAGFELDTNQYK